MSHLLAERARLLPLARDIFVTVLHELRVLGNFERPRLVVREVPMEHIELEPRHLLKRALDDLLAEEVARVVEVDAAPLELRRVLDLHTRIDMALLLRVRPPHVEERHLRVVRARVVRVADGHAVRPDRKLVALGRDARHLLHLRRFLRPVLATRRAHLLRRRYDRGVRYDRASVNGRASVPASRNGTNRRRKNKYTYVSFHRCVSLFTTVCGSL